MSWFAGKKRLGSLTSEPDESTAERQELLERQREKLTRAEELKIRSSAVAESLAQEGLINHWAQRIRESYVNTEGKPNNAHP